MGESPVKPFVRKTGQRRHALATSLEAAAHRGGGSAVSGTLPASSLARAEAGTAALPVVQVCPNQTPQGSWQAELALGPADHIIVDGRSAAHAVQQLLAVLPVALAARPQHREGHMMLTIHALHPSGFAVFLQVPCLEEIDATVADLLRRGYRPAAPGDGWPRTPEGVPLCPTHRVPMRQEEQQGETWYAHQMSDPRTGALLSYRGYAGPRSPGWAITAAEEGTGGIWRV